MFEKIVDKFENIYYPISRWWSELRFRLRQCRYMLRHGWFSCEAWNLDKTLAQFMIPRLERLIEAKHGCPIAMFDKDPSEMTEEEENAVYEAWEAKLNGYLKAFEYIEAGYQDNCLESMDFGKNTEITYEKNEKNDFTVMKFNKSPEQEEIDRKAINYCNKEYERIMAQLEDFGKFIPSLWD